MTSTISIELSSRRGADFVVRFWFMLRLRVQEVTGYWCMIRGLYKSNKAGRLHLTSISISSQRTLPFEVLFFYCKAIYLIATKKKTEFHTLSFCHMPTPHFIFLPLYIYSIAGDGQDFRMVLTSLWRSSPRRNNCHLDGTLTHIRSVVPYVFINRDTS